MKVKVLVKNAIKCKKCDEVIESKYTHDFKWCSCGSCAVDGGHDYLRRCGELTDWEDVSEYKEIEIEPKYQKGDKVKFKYFFNEIIEGTIQIVDTYPGTTTIEYDILDEKEPRLYKHIFEKEIIEMIK